MRMMSHVDQPQIWREEATPAALSQCLYQHTTAAVTRCLVLLCPAASNRPRGSTLHLPRGARRFHHCRDGGTLKRSALRAAAVEAEREHRLRPPRRPRRPRRHGGATRSIAKRRQVCGLLAHGRGTGTRDCHVSCNAATLMCLGSSLLQMRCLLA